MSVAPDLLMTAKEWEAFDAPDQRYELSDGVLVMSPRPILVHQHLCRRLANVLDEQLATAVPVLEVEVVIDSAHPPTYRTPDISVVRAEVVSRGPAGLVPADVLLAVEVVSPGSRTTDDITKPYQYARAGIPLLLIGDVEAEPQLTLLQLHSGGYRMTQSGAMVNFILDSAPINVTLSPLLRT